MPMMTVILEGDNAWPDLKDKEFIHLGNEAPAIEVAVLSAGMTSGRPSVGIKIELPDGQTVVAETSALLFCTAAKAIMARYPRMFD